MKKITIVFEMIVLIGLAGCSKSGGSEENREKSIVGKWQQIEAEGKPQIIEFLKDEKVLIYDLEDVNKKEEVGLSGDYKFVNGKTIRMNVALFGPFDAEISPSGDEITLTNPFGKIETYRRTGEFGREGEDLKKNILGKYKVPTETFMEILSEKGTGFTEKYLEFKNDNSLLFSESGSNRTWQGKWEIVPVIKFSYPIIQTYYVSGRKDKREEEAISFEGEIKGDGILMKIDFPGLKSRPWIEQVISKDDKIWTKQKGSVLIERSGSRNTIWSEYTHPDATLQLKLQKNSTFVATFSGIYKVSEDNVTFYDPRGKEESLELKINSDSLAYSSSGTASHVFWIKQDNARVIRKMNEGILWDQYRAPDRDTSFLKLEKNGSGSSGFSGNLVMGTGIICHLGDKEWKLEKREDELIWPTQSTIQRTIYTQWEQDEQRLRATPQPRTADRTTSELSQVSIPGKYILEEVDSQGKVLAREPGVMTFQKDGTIIGSYSGKWQIDGNQIEFFEGDKKVASGQLSGGSIVNWQVYDVPAWQTEKILKKMATDANGTRQGEIFSRTDWFSPENRSISLGLGNDCTFSMSGLLEEKWKIENGLIQIYKDGQKTDFTDGKLEGNNIMFKSEDGFTKLTRQN